MLQVIGAAWYWHSWKDTDYDELAQALIAGHLIECSGYVTGSNFAGFYEYPLDELYDISFGIAEIEKDGGCVFTKHDGKNGFVSEDTVKCQFLYELQGNVYLNSDVKAILDGVQVEEVSKNRYDHIYCYSLTLTEYLLTIIKRPSMGHQRRSTTPNNQTRHFLPRRLPIRNRRKRHRLQHIREIRPLGAHDQVRPQASRPARQIRRPRIPAHRRA